MLRITARFADEWNTWGAPSMAGAARTKYDTACASVERDPTSMWTSVQALVFITDDDAHTDRVKAGPMGARAIAGSPDQLVDTMGEYAELGFDEFIVPDWNLGKTPEDRRQALERINDSIVSQFG